MSQLVCVTAVLVVLVAAGLIERLRRNAAWRAIPIRVHVNGTRGKSTVTRMIAAALRAAGVPTLAKVTGTEPRLILPDGTERSLRRRGPANIREQLRTLFLARRLGARALVVECMALQPDLQWTSEHAMLASTCGVITNVRTDHTEVMGKGLDEIAASLANTVPAAAVLVLGEERFEETFGARARALDTRMIVIRRPEQARDEGRWFEEDMTVALEVTRQLAVPDEVARPAMLAARPDPGAFRALHAVIEGRQVPVLDARAANDPESLSQLLGAFQPDVASEGSILAIYNHRDDRPERLRSFAPFFAGRTDIDLIITGDRPALTLQHALRQILGRRTPPFVSRQRLLDRLPTLAKSARAVVLCGNTRALSPSRWCGAMSDG